MKRTALFISLLTCVSGFTIAADRLDVDAVDAAEEQSVPVAITQSANTIRISTRPEILGLWGMVIPKNKKCTEYYNFRGDNQVVVHSAKEWSTGIYDYQPSPDNTATKPPALILQMKYENNQVDCSGNREDQSGEISQYYVRWKDNNTINFCASEEADKCFATLHRVLP
ncbi:hypothetical protein [Acinetobacter sp. WZC-1]|uniref:hypothetical protein n=1 Tax=Acinetobacter sp. WZC-1 TaxID=3459034 RepID=UPI00403D6259